MHKANDKKLPKNYEGPVSGYYNRVNKFFEKKKSNMETSQKKLNAVPSINKKRSKSRESAEIKDISIEERLLKKGEEYKQNLSMKIHE